MGEVFLAHDTQLDRRVALKVPTITDDDDGEMAERFIREARSAASLEHPNICPIYDVGSIDGTLFVTMAYIKGQKLSRAIGNQPIPQRSAVVIVRKVALALDRIHRNGVIHRDVKPDNIMLNQDGEPFVMDFGIARRTIADDVTRLTQTGTLLGTPAYMSPEQIDIDREVDARTDIYSLGVTLYEMLTGHIPFDGPIPSVIHGIMTKTPRNPSQWNSKIDRVLESICLKMMAKNVNDRIPTMRHVAYVLGDWNRSHQRPDSSAAVLPSITAHSTEEAATPTVSVTTFPTFSQQAIPSPKRRNKHWIVAVIVMLLAIATMYFTQYFLERSQVVVRKDEQGTVESVFFDLSKDKLRQRSRKRLSLEFKIKLDSQRWNTDNITQLRPLIMDILGNGFDVGTGDMKQEANGEIRGIVAITAPASASPKQVARLLETVSGVQKATPR